MFKSSEPLRLLGASLAALCGYLALQALVALACVRGILPENQATAAQAVCCALSVFAAAFYTAGRTALGPLTSALAAAGGFLVLLLLAGFLIYGGLSLKGEGSALIAAALIAGGAGGLLRCGRRRHPHKKAAMAVGRRKRAGR